METGADLQKSTNPAAGSYSADGRACYLGEQLQDVLTQLISTGTATKSKKGEKLETSAKLAEFLLNDYAVAVIPCADFGFPNHIRLSYAISIGQIEKGLGRIEEFLKELQ